MAEENAEEKRYFEVGLECSQLVVGDLGEGVQQRFVDVEEPRKVCSPCVVLQEQNASGVWKELARTEIMSETLTPTFAHWIPICYDPSRVQPLKFVVHSIDKRRHLHFIVGEFRTTLRRLILRQKTVSRTRNTLTRSRDDSLPKAGEPALGKLDIILVGADKDESQTWARMQLQTTGLPRGQKIDTFLEVFRDSDGCWDLVYRSEVVHDTGSPLWEGFGVPLSRLCSKDLRRLVRIVVKEWRPDYIHRPLCALESRVKKLLGHDEDPTYQMPMVPLHEEKGRRRAAPAKAKLRMHINAFQDVKVNLADEKTSTSGCSLICHHFKLYSVRKEASDKQCRPNKYLYTSSLNADRDFLQRLYKSKICQLDPEAAKMVQESLWSMAESQQRFANHGDDDADLIPIQFNTVAKILWLGTYPTTPPLKSWRATEDTAQLTNAELRQLPWREGSARSRFSRVLGRNTVVAWSSSSSSPPPLSSQPSSAPPQHRISLLSQSLFEKSLDFDKEGDDYALGNMFNKQLLDSRPTSGESGAVSPDMMAVKEQSTRPTRSTSPTNATMSKCENGVPRHSSMTSKPLEDKLTAGLPPPEASGTVASNTKARGRKSSVLGAQIYHKNSKNVSEFKRNSAYISSLDVEKDEDDDHKSDLVRHIRHQSASRQQSFVPTPSLSGSLRIELSEPLLCSSAKMGGGIVRQAPKRISAQKFLEMTTARIDERLKDLAESGVPLSRAQKRVLADRARQEEAAKKQAQAKSAKAWAERFVDQKQLPVNLSAQSV
ncbi:hypothetical protein CYMTET_12280 [Cymbomonas tetramitiformis]|uniref:C2 domain-containing protein n=1 Tax=Cymbomonas tetramitiformis TaxID=36881 RepID=A0AAE0GKV6_9CHLO|nr:hypothetical protein CYMTET_12280 [Cymbomonas tetramitiformis]